MYPVDALGYYLGRYQVLYLYFAPRIHSGTYQVQPYPCFVRSRYVLHGTFTQYIQLTRHHEMATFSCQNQFIVCGMALMPRRRCLLNSLCVTDIVSWRRDSWGVGDAAAMMAGGPDGNDTGKEEECLHAAWLSYRRRTAPALAHSGRTRRAFGVQGGVA